VLNYKRNDSLVFDAAGKCILSLHSLDDLMPSQGSTSTGKNHSAKPVQKTSARPEKRRRAMISDSDGDEDRPSKKRAPQRNTRYLPNESTEGLYFILPDASSELTCWH
jgi:hypothetical protein